VIAAGLLTLSSVRVGLEATGYSRWLERLLAELGMEVGIGDPAEIKTKRVKKQKTDREDARLLLRLLREDRFPRIWVPSPENRDLRQLLWHRHRLVQMHTRIMNQLQALAMNEGYRWKKKLFSEQGREQLEKLTPHWASRDRGHTQTHLFALECDCNISLIARLSRA
jgi:transposase